MLTRIFPSVLSDGAHTASSACLTVSSLSESGRQVNLCGLEMFEKVVYKEGRKSKSIRMEKTASYQLVFFLLQFICIVNVFTGTDACIQIPFLKHRRGTSR